MKICFGLILFIALFVILSYYILNNTGSDYDSDFVEGTLWAKASIDSGRVLSDTFYYPYAIPFGSNLLFIPFVKLFGVSLLANRVGMFFFFIIVCGVFLYFSSAFNVGKGDTFFIISLLIMAFVNTLAFNLLLHILYYLLDYVCLVGMIGALMWIDKSKGKRIHYVLLALFTLWGAANGAVSACLSVFPMLIALVFSGHKKPSNNVVWIVIVFLICGLILYKVTMIGVIENKYIENASSYRFRDVSNWFENLNALPAAWIKLFITNDPTGISVFSAKGVLTVIELGLMLLFTGIPLPYILNYKKLKEAEKWVFISAAVVWIITLAQFIFFRGAEGRLLYNGVLVNSMLIAVWFLRLRIELNNWRNILVCGLAEAMLVFTCLMLVMEHTGPVHNVLAEELEKRGLTHGYATYWNSNNVSVCSEGKIKSCTVFADEGKITPRIYNIDSMWYMNQPGDFYLALTEAEEENISWNRFYKENAKDYFNIDKFKVYIFDEHWWNYFQSNMKFSYDFLDDKWQRGCSTNDHERYVHDGGLSYGPYLSARKEDVCYVRIQGEALSHADIQAYYEQGKKLYEPEFELLSDNKVLLKFYISEDTDSLEVVIGNPKEDQYTEDIVVSTVDISINELVE